MTTIFVCCDEPNPAVDLTVPGAEVVQLDELCAKPRQIIPLVAEEETKLVFMIHRRHTNLGAIQAAVRELGLDALGIGVVDLAELTDGQQSALACRAKLARMSRYEGSAPEQVKLMPAERNTRRTFLSVGPPVYVGAPMINHDICTASDGCRICALRCPVGALDWGKGSMRYDVNTCVACGICVTACPVSATRNPVVDPATVETEISAVVDLATEPIGIRYRCRDSSVQGEPGWHIVEVPCTGMLTLTWLLGPLLHGAMAVDAVACDQGGCRLGNGRRLEEVWSDFELVLGSMPQPLACAKPTSSIVNGWLSMPPGHVLAELLSGEGESASLELRAADVGLVSVDEAVCTACEMCCKICPTDALRSSMDGSGIHISFDHRACVGCEQCVGTCPERDRGAISVTHRFDSLEWVAGPKEVRHEPTPSCEVCGRPVAPAAMLDRIREMLGDDSSATVDLISRRCVDCKGR